MMLALSDNSNLLLSPGPRPSPRRLEGMVASPLALRRGSDRLLGSSLLLFLALLERLGLVFLPSHFTNTINGIMTYKHFYTNAMNRKVI